MYTKRLLFTGLPAFMIAIAGFSQTVPQLGKDPVAQVVAAMTLEEKAAMVVGMGMNFPGAGGQREQRPERVSGAAGSTLEIPRLGIPSIVVADGPAGLRIQPMRSNDSTKTYYCTAFPIATLLASSWDTAMVTKVGAAMGNEVKEYGVDIILGPALNIHRNPLGGRNFEYFSEDPLVSGRMASSIVKGVQSQGVGTSVKHFVANNHEWDRTVLNVIVSDRALREIYLKGFEIAVEEAQPWTVMTSYNKVNGTYTSEREDLIMDVLRKDWGFKGAVMTDWFGGRDAVAQMKAGNDLLMPGNPRQQEAIVTAVKSGALDEKTLDRNVQHLLNLVMLSPTFKGYHYANKPELEAHAALTREAASNGMVLLRNENGALPFSTSAKVAAFGNSGYDMITGGTGSGDVNEAYSVSMIDGLSSAGFMLNQQLASTYASYLEEEKAKQPKRQSFFQVIPPIPERPVGMEEVNAAASASDVALITLGRNSGEGRDRVLEGDFELSEAEAALIANVAKGFHAKGKKIVVALNIGGVIETASWRDQADAILLVWQPGQEAGNSVADVLSGKVNPSGKLVTTFPVSYDELSTAKDFPGKVLEGPDPNATGFFRGDRAAEITYNEGIYVGYRYFTSAGVKPAYPFGFGLSYTQFEYSGLKLSAKDFKGSITASVSVRNTGKAAGREVVELYLSAPAGKLIKPTEELRAFAKTRLLQPGETQSLTFTLTGKDLSSFDPSSSSWVIEGGIYTVRVGASSGDIRQTASFNAAPATVIKETEALKPEMSIEEISVKK